MKANYYKTIFLSAVLFASVSSMVTAQEDKHCGTLEATQQLYAKHPELAADWDTYNQQLITAAKAKKQARAAKSATPPQIYIIPIVFHIIHQNGTENISDAQILDQVAILNRDYRKLNADTSAIVPAFDTLAADTYIEFRLAKLDPQGNCTNGIDRIYSHLTNSSDDASKLNQWPRDKYLNVWVVKTIGSAGVAGYAFYPSAVAGMSFPFDGVIILNDYIGSLGTSIPSHSRALTHEIGHYLSLAHTWGSTNNPGVACGDDGVDDTPETKGHSTCMLSDAVCNPPIVENVQNYMEYSYCSNMFTYDQMDRMRAALESPVSGRNNLHSTSNLIATGVDASLPVTTCTPKPEFYASRTRLCAGGTVTFTKNVLMGTETSRTWTFAGGTPATSTAANPVVTYSTPGLYEVDLSATNTAGTGTVTKVGYIRVDAASASNYGLFYDGFETVPYSDFFWTYGVKNLDTLSQTWDLTSSAGYLSSRSAVMNGYGNYHSDVDELYTPTFDLSALTSCTMTFRLAGSSHAGTSLDMNEALKIYVSTNCGQTWSLRSTLTGTGLCNNGYQPNYYVPASASEWALKTVTVPSLYTTSDVIFKFEYTSGNESNNIYIDDININGTVGIDENTMESANLSIYPNPSSDASTIAYHLNKPANTKVEIVDVLGKVIYTSATASQAEGDHTLTVSKAGQNLRNGIYFVKLTVENQSMTQKLIITQ